MSLLTHAFKSLLKLGEIVGGGGAGKVARILREHFTLTAFQLAETYQTSYLNTLEAIRRGCAPRWMDWRSQVEKEFSNQVRLYYFVEFANEKAWTDAEITQFKQRIAVECDKLLKCKAVIFESDGQLFDEKTLAGLLTTEKLSNLTDLVFERLQVLKITISPEVANFLRYRELLGKGIEFFVRNDREITHRLHALQAAGLWDTMQEVKQIVESLQQVGIRPRIEAEDEFKTYDSESIKRVGQAVVLLKNQPFKPADQGRALLMAGTAILALNSLDEAKRLLEEALQLAQCDEERALAHFNLFQVYLRYSEPNYNDIAFEHLQTALALDAPKTFHFYEPRKYSLLKLLGAGGMGCAFLAEDVSFERKVVLKAFWKTFEQETRDLFREVLAMKKVSRQFVPEPFGVEFYGHHAYLLTEYIENALDGEQWLRDKGKLNNELAVDVAWQIATGLHAAHQQGVLHLDLKPANVLLIPTADRVAVKLIDFGLAKVVTPLQTQARRTQKQSTQFGKRVAGTWIYASPEQQGDVRFGEVSAKSDVFSFGKTMMRLCSGRDPANCRERDVPDGLRDLLFDCIEEKPVERPEFSQVIALLQASGGKQARVETQRQQDELQQLQAQREREEQELAQQRIAIERQQREETDRLKVLQTQREREEQELQQRVESERKQREEATRLKQLQEQREREKREWEQQQAELVRKQRQETERLEKLQEQRRSTEKVISRAAREEAFTFETVVKVIEESAWFGLTTRFKPVIEKRQAKQLVYDLGKGVKVELVYIPAGKFTMGSLKSKGYNNEGPLHNVVIAKPFYMGKYPVTREQWQAMMGKNLLSYFTYFKGAKRPVEPVSWNDAKKFCDKLSLRVGEKFDLPSEAMWEYACRAGTTTKYSFGDVITPQLASYSRNIGETTYSLNNGQAMEVGKYPANAFGLYDMHGNVWEWCEDVWHNNYEGAPVDGSAWINGDSSTHIIRGGSWENNDNHLCCAYRFWALPAAAPHCFNKSLGIRISMR